ncbi:hypothetical protein H0H93_013033 [Arthromyces matolae]|nr:hypothetical protein H0H93_013033 [Arthromyces matolae]
MARNIIYRGLATLTQQFKAIQYTSEGAVSISYPTLIAAPSTLKQSIEEAFGSHPKSLGIIIIRDLPVSYAFQRERLLKLAYKFANLDKSTQEKYTDPGSNYSIIAPVDFEHILKGSYYANPIIDVPTVSENEGKAYPEYYGENIWPAPDQKGIEGFRDAFKDLGRSELSQHEFYDTVKARLLHYFPPPRDVNDPSQEETVDNWCGFHLDHSMLTGLCSVSFQAGFMVLG